MLVILKVIYLGTLLVWVGAVVCLSLLVAPALFKALPVQTAGEAVAAIFPRYYAVNGACGALLLLVSGGLYTLLGAPWWWRVNTALFAVMLLATVYAGLVVHPRAAVLRQRIHAAALSEARAEFRQLHRMAVGLNAVVLLCGMGAVVVTASRLRW